MRSTNAVFTGEGAKGEFTIYDVSATDEEGNPITLPLRSFSSLEEYFGKATMFEIDPYITKTGETTYTLKPPRKSGGARSAAPKVDAELLGRVERLEAAVRALQSGEASPSLDPPDAVAPPVRF